jgi:hypothetical protein
VELGHIGDWSRQLGEGVSPRIVPFVLSPQSVGIMTAA